MSLSKEQMKSLRVRAHQLNPIVTVADKGLHEGVINELERALWDHELVKVKLTSADRELRQELIGEIQVKLRSELVQSIGKVAVFYRESDKKKNN